MEEPKKPSKMSLELKQTPEGVWHVNSFRINAESLDELDSLLLQALNKVKERVFELNSHLSSKERNGRGKKKEEIHLSQEEEKLFENFKRLRTFLARREGVPPYVIFHDSTLKRLTQERPEGKDEVVKVIGEKRFDKYGELVLELIEGYKKGD